MSIYRGLIRIRVALSAALLASLPLSAGAATITVTTLADVDVGNDGQCSLREAIRAANDDLPYHECASGSGHDRIEFSVTGTSVLNADLPEISEALTIAGPGRDALVLDGNDQFEILRFDAAGAQLLKVSELTLARALGGFGAALVVQLDDSATISDLLISDCNAGFGGAALWAEDAGTIQVLDSELRGNRGDLGGGAVYVSASANLFVQDSTIAENFAGPPDGTTDAHGGGLYVSFTPFELRRSTVSGNGARGHGGGLFVSLSDGVIRNSTVVGNFADPDGDGHSGGGLRIENAGGQEVQIGTTIVAGNTDGSVAVDFHPDLSLASGSVATLSYNWIGDHASVEATFPLPGTPGDPNLNADFAGDSSAPIDPGLSALGDFGGPTRTHRPQPASGVIDQGNCPVATQDQRGYRNPDTGRRTVDVPSIPNLGDGCDIGSVERGASAPVVDALPFLDGFESGDTGGWSSTTG